jgi:hypothetical protein
MPLSWNEIKSRAAAFSRNWTDAGNEDSQAKPFLIDFFEVFGITDKRVASFEHAVEKHGGGRGFHVRLPLIGHQPASRRKARPVNARQVVTVG